MSTDPRDRKDELQIRQDLEMVRKAWKRNGRAEPPEMLDLAVLNTARRALAGRSRRPMRWLGGFATATVVVLALTLVIEQEQESPAPTLKEGDGLRLESAAPQASRDAALDEAVPERKPQRVARKSAAEQAEAHGAQEALMKQSTAPAASSAVMAEAEEGSFRLEERTDTVDPQAEAWLLRLLEMQATGRLDELERELAAFRESYPDYPLPPALRDVRP